MRTPRLRKHTLLLLAWLLGLSAAAQQRWIADDAYISFRYARNLIEGQGLVFNAGERVEGFTNLAWTLWVALGLGLGATAETWSVLWSLAAYAGVLWLLASWPGARERGQPPVAALAAAGCSALWTYATGGLETMAFTLAVLGTLRLQVIAEASGAARAGWAAGVCAGVASALRPEGVLLALPLGAMRLVERAGRDAPRADTGTALRTLARELGGFCLVALPMFAFRWLYYGALVPNTAHAKSAELTWYDQGFAYAGFFFAQHWLLVLGPVLWLVAARTPARRAQLLPGSGRTLVLAALLAWPVLRVGGDFMHGRMWVPLVPLLLLALQAGLFALLPALAARPWIAAAAVLLAALLAPAPDAQAMWSRGVVDERTFVDPERARPRRAATFQRYFDGLDVRVAFTGGDAKLMYEARVPVALESEAGLTDAFVAHQPLAARGRVGHEKPAPLEYLVRDRGAHFTLRKRGLMLLRVPQKLPLVEVQLGDERAFCLRWDPVLMETLRQRGARFVDFLASLDRTIADLPRTPLVLVREQYGRLRLFYFEHVPDPARERPFLERLASGR